MDRDSVGSASDAHTAGPWTIPQPWAGFTKIVGGDGSLVFGLAAGDDHERARAETCEANARLIAAAPDLLSQLRVTVARLRACMIYSGTDPEYADIALADARAVIAKATQPAVEVER